MARPSRYTDEEILEYIKANPGKTQAEMADDLGYTRRHFNRVIESLRECGKIETYRESKTILSKQLFYKVVDNVPQQG